jgi:hypothetical protein
MVGYNNKKYYVTNSLFLKNKIKLKKIYFILNLNCKKLPQLSTIYFVLKGVTPPCVERLNLVSQVVAQG